MSKYLNVTFWALFQQFSKQGANLIVSIVLTRILNPEDYGIMGLITVFIVIGNILSTGGLSQSIIRKKDIKDRDYSSVFLFNILVSGFFYLLLFILAPLIAGFFGREELTVMIRVLSLTIVIGAFSSVQVATLLKEMRFRQLSLIQVPSIVVSGTCGIILALNGFGVWSLIIMALVQSVVSTAQYVYYGSWKINFVLDKKNLFEHVNFSYKIVLVDLIEQLFNYIYNLFIGKWYSLVELGYYTRAITLRDLPVNNIAMALNKITYSIFSDISDKLERQKMMFSNFIKISFYLLTPLLLLCIVIARPLFEVLLTAKWLGAVEYFQILCLAGILMPINRFTLNVLNIAGRSDLFLYAEMVKKVVMVIGILISFNFGIKGILYFQLIFTVLSYLINSLFTRNYIHLSIIDQIGLISKLLLLNTLVFVGTYLLSINVIFENIQHSIFQILIIVPLFIALYVVLSSLLNVKEYYILKELITKKIFKK